MEKKVLVECPTYEGMSYYLDKFLDRVKSLRHRNYDVLIFDNSLGLEYFDKLSLAGGVVILRNEFGGSVMEKEIHSRNLILDYAVEKGYDFVLMLDQDMIAPENVISSLLDCGKDIVFGLYFNYFMASGETKFLPVTWTTVEMEVFEELKRQGILPGGIRQADLRRHLTSEEIN